MNTVMNLRVFFIKRGICTPPDGLLASQEVVCSVELMCPRVCVSCCVVGERRVVFLR
jgi:hypothetical protein